MTSAATTAFSTARLDGPGGFHLWFDGNGKITAGNGTLDAPKPNAFSLMHIKDCPGSTEACRASCYVHGLKAAVPETYELYAHNSRTIRDILRPPLARQWANLAAQWITENCAGGFRWHVSGDVFSLTYATWIVDVCALSPTVRHWIYTRSFDCVDALMLASTEHGGNLAINLSADADNWRRAAEIASSRGLRICYMTQDGSIPVPLSVGDVIFPDYNLRDTTGAGKEWFSALRSAQKKMVCPVDYHGKSERRRCGPCNRCLI